MNAPRARRRRRLLVPRLLRGLRSHSFTLLSVAVLSVIAFVALSSDAFRTSRANPGSPPEPSFRVSWAPATTVDPEVAASYAQGFAALTPLERARQRPRVNRPDGSIPFPVTLPEASEQERAEFLLTALKDAEALGLTLQLSEN